MNAVISAAIEHPVLGILVSWLVFASGQVFAQPPRPEVARYGEAYVGHKGLRVYVAPLANGKQAMVQFAYINHAWDRQIFMCDVEAVKAASGTRIQYSRSVGGQSAIILITWADGSGEAYIQGEAEPRKITYIESESREVNNEHLLTVYLEQQDKLREEQRKKK
jgi:hypothetical protein